ncbi:DUF501 domain-containing protein [Luteimicrobium xylanilyticum]|uniref:Septum formation initiator family protein n=1 Tax=Luteimicrobium xylanilyticum TaxID=1133546 RepID=A0A5P9QFK4_9MICO|nr:DUF501 domain-containing protein [Luteimicrobium xylanilyticum]QFU99225.1 hypothetical protein KDY119_02752 [Luteimicrobium xylanilyticum]
MPLTDVTADDLAVLAEQLGRTPRGVVAIGARCVCGRPLVAVTAPRLDDGTPFPTTFYLTHPGVVAAMSTLEARGVMRELNDRLAEDEELAAGHTRAHDDYLARRAEVAARAGTGEVPEIAGISAGGLPTRVKCLHALAGHALVAGPGVDVVGDLALQQAADEGLWSADRCTC